MAGYMSGYQNVVSVLHPQGATDLGTRMSDYIKLDQYDKVTFVVEVGCITTLMTTAACCTGIVTAALYSAHAADGSGSAAIGAYTTIGSTSASATYIKGAQAALYMLSTLSTHGNTLAINDITYTFSTVATVTTGTFNSNRYIAINATPTATGITDTYHHLAAYINHATYGVTGINARYGVPAVSIFTSSSGHVYLSGMGNVTLTVQATSSEVLKPLSYVGMLETNGAEIAGLNTSHKYVAVQITQTSPAVISAFAIRHTPRYTYSSTAFIADVVGRTT